MIFGQITSVSELVLLQAHLDGVHLVTLPPEVCRRIEDWTAFSEDERAAARKIRIKHPEHGALRRNLQTYSKVVDSGVTLPHWTGTCWQVPFQWIAERSLKETQLLAEDLYDIEVLKGAANDYQWTNNLRAFRVRCYELAGGGGNCHRVLTQHAIERQGIVLCNVDSDREGPDSELGETAQKCIDVSGDGLYQVYTTMGRELENMLPWRLIDLVRDKVVPLPSAQLAWLSRIDERAACFSDLKRGMFGFDLIRLTGTTAGAYWLPIARKIRDTPNCCAKPCAAPKVGDCRDRLTAGFGNATLRDVSVHLKDTSLNPSRHQAYSPSPGIVEWQAIGRQVFEFCLGAESRRI